MAYAGRVRGVILLSYLDAVQKVLGQTGHQELVDGLSGVTRGLLPTLHTSGYFSEDLLADMIRVVLERGGTEKVRAVGYKQMELMIQRTHRWFARLAGPHRLLQISAKAWRQFREEPSAMTTERSSERSARVRITSHPAIVAPGYAESLAASCCAALDATRAKHARCTAVTLAPPDACVLDFEWD